jgi:histidinol phosphatase-like PHP family hydrolase
MKALLLAVAACAACLAQNAVEFPGEGLEEGLFSLRQMDFHLHSGMERPVELEKWIDIAVADGRKVILLVDHLELYRKTAAAYQLWRAHGGFQAQYPVGAEGHKAVFADFDAAARRKDVLIFKGWEVSETELDTGLELSPMRMADVIGWHISPRNGAEPPDGRSLLKRVRQIKEAQKQLAVPMIVLHPFPMRLENIRKTAAKNGRDLHSVTVDEYRFFRPGEQEELIRLLRGTSIYIEMNRDTEQYFDDPACREALIADIAPLARAGVQFTIASDNHHMRAAGRPFQPELYCLPAGVTLRNTNAIVRELLALRAKRSLVQK